MRMRRVGGPMVAATVGCLSDVPFRADAVMLGSSEEEHPGDCRWCAQPLGTAVLPGRVGHGGPVVPSLVSVSRRVAGPARESAVPETIIMKITGHRTRAMFDRYNITSESDMAYAAELLEEFRLSKNARTAPPTVPKPVPVLGNTNGPGSLQSH